MLTTDSLLQNRYRIISLLGQGGMGAVYRAWDVRLKVSVALKEMVPQPGLDAQELKQLRQQFEHEAVTLARMNHPNLVRVTDFFEESDNAYLVMDFVEGESLADRIAREGPQPETQVLAWARQLLGALDYCHNQDVLHRDIKPQNIIIDARGQAVLVDFGLVKLWNPNDPRTQTVMRGLGTPEYAPPEQYDAGSGHTSPASDIYSLGATLYHTLTGQSPPTATMRVVNPGALVPIRQFVPKVTVQTESVINKATELRPTNRYQTARQMASALPGATQPVAPQAPAQPPAYTPTAVLPGTPPRPPSGSMARPSSQPMRPSQPMPSSRPMPAPRRSRRWVWLVGGLGAIVACVLLIVAGNFGLQMARDMGFLDTATKVPTTHPTVTESPRATATQSAEGTPPLNATATAEAQATATVLARARATAQAWVAGTATAQADATVTAEADRAASAGQAATWSLLLYDDFSVEANGWPTGDYDGDLVTGSRTIAGGKYAWETTSIGDFVWPATPDVEDVSDVYLTVTAQRTFGTTDGRYGLVFRRADKDNYYMFRVTDNGVYQFRVRYEGEWNTILDWTETAAIRAGRENVLTVVAEGTDFTFFINDQFVAATTDSRLSSGVVGVIVGLEEGNRATFAFSEFEVRVP